MISIHEQVVQKAKEHMKKNWKKYAVGAGMGAAYVAGHKHGEDAGFSKGTKLISGLTQPREIRITGIGNNRG